jgi:hypothetical protein
MPWIRHSCNLFYACYAENIPLNHRICLTEVTIDNIYIPRSYPANLEENPTWGAPRIHGERLLGFDISERT